MGNRLGSSGFIMFDLDQTGPHHPTACQRVGTSRGKILSSVCINPRFWQRFCGVKRPIRITASSYKKQICGCLVDFNLYPVSQSKAKSIGDVLMNGQNAEIQKIKDDSKIL
jgi:hypothetical protein